MKKNFDYALDRAKKHVEESVKSYFENLPDLEIPSVRVEYPPPGIEADLAVPCFTYAKALRKAPPVIAGEIAAAIKVNPGGFIQKVEAAGGFLNITLNSLRMSQEIFADLENYGEGYGNLMEGGGKTVVIDYSSPNIAKPFSVGNIRSTVIGQAIYNILKSAGYKVIGDNHIGDWGTQFGKLIYAYQMWGDKEKVEKNPIKELLDLYVEFHKEAKKFEDENLNPLEEEARKRFKLLEEGDSEVEKLWKWFVDVSLEDFQRIYDRLGVKFDLVLGESFYNDKSQRVVEILRQKGIGEEDPEGAFLVRLDKYGIQTPLLITKSDGATLYATRDLAGLLYRIEEFSPEMLLYVVGSEQKLHFTQCFQVIKMLGYETRCEHIDFGMVSLKEGKMSTREGRVIFFEDVLEEGFQRARQILLEKRPDLPGEEVDKIAEIVAVGAVKFNDLSQSRTKNVVFDWDKMLSFDGDSAPYLQYSYARVNSILRKAEKKALKDPKLLQEPEEIALLYCLSRFHEAVRGAVREFAPHIIAQYLLETARIFTSFYQNVPVLKAADENLVEARLALIEFYAGIIKKGLALLGIEVLERM